MNTVTHRLVRDARALAVAHRDKLPYIGAILVCLIIYAFSRSQEGSVQIYRNDNTPDFKDARVLGSQGDSLYEGKEKLLGRTIRELMAAQATLRDSNIKLQARFDALEKSGTLQTQPNSPVGPTPLPSPSGLPGAPPPQDGVGEKSGLLGKEAIHVSKPSETLEATEVNSPPDAGDMGGTSRSQRYEVGPRRSNRSGGGSSIISFPVKDVAVEHSEGVALPAGSYVKAKLMTGIEAPEGKTYPVLLQLDYAYIVPNKHKLDLSGCFMIAKSQGDLSTERVQMQATKLSCVSKDGKMFERDVNGFIADDRDNSFAVIGSVNSKQERVAAMAFLSSIVDGVGKALQQAQSTQQTTPLGGSQSVMTGSQGEFLAAGGASNAASQVTQWYLKQAQNLLPTINVGSGHDVWIVMQDTVKLPNDYFRKNVKGGPSESIYSYFSRIID